MICTCTLLAGAALAPQQDAGLTVFVDRLHAGDGTVVSDARVRIEDGRIASVTADAEPGDALHLAGAEMTPGLVDAFSFAGVGSQALEQARENTASMRVADTADLDAAAFAHAAGEGVTAAYLSPDTYNVFGGLGAVVKTAGGRPADLFAEAGTAARVLDPAAGVKVTLGNDAAFGNWTPRGRWTTSFRARRPNTRMGTTWIVRRDFYRAGDYLERKQAGMLEREDPALEVLAAALQGEIPVRFQARESHDVQTALRLQREFGLPRVIIEGATEGHEAAKLVAAAGVPVVCGPAFDEVARAVAEGPTAAQLAAIADPPPICCEHLDEDVLLGEELEHAAHAGGWDEERGLYEVKGFGLELLTLLSPRYGAASGFARGRMSEGRNATPALAALLADAGVEFALGAAEGHDQPLTEASVIHQARTAVRWGLDPADALRRVTSVPAQLCGMGDRLGRIAAGYDADLVLWSGDPLSAGARPLLVLVDGEIVVDHRNDS